MQEDRTTTDSESTELSCGDGSAQDILKFFEALHAEGPIAICCKKIVVPEGDRQMVGQVFTDYEGAAAYAAQQDATGEFSGIYTQLNRLKPDATNIPPKQEDIAAYTNLRIDIDRREDKSGNATDEELAAIEKLKDIVAADLNERFNATALEDFTGNGFGLVYLVDPLPPDQRGLITGFLRETAEKYEVSGLNACIDTSVGDPQRLIRICGTVNRKFPEQEGRRYHRAKLLKAPMRVSIERGALGVSAGTQTTEPSGPAKYAVPLKDRVDFAAELARKLKIKTSHKQIAGVGKVACYAYHGIGRQPCLVAGHVHEPNANNPDCSVFMETETHGIFHQCFARGCQERPGSKTRTALRTIGLENLVVVGDGSDWRDGCHSFSQLTEEPPEHIVERLVPEKCVTMYTGPSFHGKTWLALDTAYSIVTGTPLLKFFKAQRTPVLYHVPEMNESLFRYRLKQLGFDNLPDPEMFLCRPMEAGTTWALDSSWMKLSSKGRVIFLDTMMYFNAASDMAAYAEVRKFAEDCFNLIVLGCQGIVALYHPPKVASGQDEMTLQNYVLGSAGYGGILGSCIGFNCLNHATLHIYLQQLKSRGPLLEPFQIEGFENSRLKMSVEPGPASPYLPELKATLSGGKGEDPKYRKAVEMFKNDKKLYEVRNELKIGYKKADKFWQKYQDERDLENTNPKNPQLGLVETELDGSKVF